MASQPAAPAPAARSRLVRRGSPHRRNPVVGLADRLGETGRQSIGAWCAHSLRLPFAAAMPRGVGESPEDEPGDSEVDQNQSCDCQGFHQNCPSTSDASLHCREPVALPRAEIARSAERSRQYDRSADVRARSQDRSPWPPFGLLRSALPDRAPCRCPGQWRRPRH